MKIQTQSLCFYYHRQQVLRDINLHLPANKITAITGPSGSGKSTLLMAFNRLWEEIDGCRISGEVFMHLNGQNTNIYNPTLPLLELRRKVGMVFQQPNPLPMSISKNIAFPLRLAHIHDKRLVGQKVESALRKVALWDEVKDRLNDDGRLLSGGQQQRLCLARALVLRPEVLLLDEPTSSLDPDASAAIEELLLSLKTKCTLIMVSHYQDQIQRIADLHVQVLNGQCSISSNSLPENPSNRLSMN
ncbi:phosphate ABC transporter ATP-binding protein [Desulfogranum marinum]|uniref:phosphate ABC transporter ATP-binding protein n=1 Tax=Desulfogranum marinum TaxID=453220 RepID=UPI001963C7CD|nr:phosphate ABC transporter ATP-binding protein [Desulfogranum marinum]MBM9514598.1 phosphate ABC transporter ATP-binding protein [Desulfogranum marinum]